MLNTKPNPYLFLFTWTMHSIIAWCLGIVACLFFWFPVHFLLMQVSKWVPADTLLGVLSVVGLMLIPGTIIGRVIGWAQNDVLRDYLEWDIPHWIRQSMLGGLAGGVTVVLLLLVGSDRPFGDSVLLFLMPAFVLWLSACQWWVLRRNTHSGWLWIFGNVIAGAVFSGLLLNNPTPFADSFWMMGAWVLSGIAQSFITGVVILWLYDRPLPQRRKPARVFVDVRTDDKAKRPSDTQHWTYLN